MGAIEIEFLKAGMAHADNTELIPHTKRLQDPEIPETSLFGEWTRSPEVFGSETGR